MDLVEQAPYHLTERRIAQLTLLLGVVASIFALFLFSGREAAGVLVGAILAWWNFRWLKMALDSLMLVSIAKAGSPEARMPVSSMFRFTARYVLIAFIGYAIFYVFKVPILSILVGLCALGAATILASLYEITNPVD